jgi:ferredoxin
LGAIQIFEDRIQISEQLCNGCGICLSACPTQAIYPVEEEIPVVNQEADILATKKPEKMNDFVYLNQTTSHSRAPGENATYLKFFGNIYSGNHPGKSGRNGQGKGVGRCHRRRRRW